ncbi:MAG: response regulator [Rudaea sp.]
MSRAFALRWWASALLIAVHCAAPVAAYERIKGPAPIVDTAFRWSPYSRFSGSDGLPSATVNALAQDRNGFVYAGTQNGVAKFDGRAWHGIDLPTQNGGSDILRLAATTDGSVWIGTDDAGLFRYANGTAHSVTLPAGSPERDIEALIAADARTVYVGTSRSLYRCDAARCEELVAGRDLKVTSLLLSQCATTKCLYVGTNDSGVYRVDNPDDSRRAVRSPWHLQDELPSPAITALAQWGGNEGEDLWLGTGFGLARVTRQRVVTYGRSAEIKRHLNQVSSLLPGKNKSGDAVLHVGMAAGGVADVYMDGTWQLSDSANGLPDDGVLSMLNTDDDLRTPVLWIGLKNAGIARRDAAVWSSFDERNGLPSHAIHGMGQIEFPDGLRTQWIGTSAGLARWSERRWQIWPASSPINGGINDMAPGGGGLWIATDEGLLHARGESIRGFQDTTRGITGTIVSELLYESVPTGADALWLGTHYGLSRVQGSTATYFGLGTLATESPITAIVATQESADHRLWVATDAGLTYRRDEQWHVLSAGCEAQVVQASDVRVSKQGTPALWVSHRRGLTRINPARDDDCITVPASVIPPEPIAQVQLDETGRLYLFGQRGVIRLSPDAAAPDDLGRFHAERFGLDAGLPSLEFTHASFVDDDGRIWAASVEGAVMYDPREEILPQSPRSFRLIATHIDGSATRLTPDALLSSDENNLVFEVSLLSNQRDKLTRYRTVLDGSDEPDSDWNADGIRTYRRLPAGDYTFHAYARDGFGVEAAPLSLHFTIGLPLWRQWWALASYALAVIALATAISRWRIQRARNAAKILEKTVAERTLSLKDANAQLDLARTAAETATQAKSVFLANMSHEIRTPMNAVLGFAGLGMRMDIPPKAGDYFRKINNAGQNLLNILNDILDLSKIEAGKLALETVPFNLSDVLTQVTDLFALKASEKSIEFVVGSAPGLPDHFVGDPLRLGQVLLNLVNNAIKFTQGGFVQVFVEEIGARQNDKAILRFTVEDSGIGMSNDQIAKLFQPFSQADHSTTRNFGGTGLGLTISQRLVAQMGGVISVQSHLGAGSSFQFEIGLKLQNAGPKPHRLAPDELAGLSILVVDDSAQAREWLRDQLIALRFRVVSVDSGEAALTILQRERFDLIMMDWMMPGIDGIETTRRIRADINLSRIPKVIMVTAYGREAIREAAESVGVQRFLIKPVNPSVLLDTIVDVLDARSLAARETNPEPLPESNGLGDFNVLLVEDNLVNQQLAIDMLASAGIHADVAGNGIEALKALQTSAYDLILMDIEMPEMDGYSAAREIGARLGKAAPPIIAMTAHATADHRQRCLSAGMSDFVTKPIVFNDLIATLRQWLNAAPPTLDVAPTATQPNPMTILDIDAALARMNGNQTLLKKLLALFPAAHADTDSKLIAALARHDYKTANLIVHSTCGAAGNLSAMRLWTIASDLEDAIVRIDEGAIQTLLPTFRAALADTNSACADTLARL